MTQHKNRINNTLAKHPFSLTQRLGIKIWYSTTLKPSVLTLDDVVLTAQRYLNLHSHQMKAFRQHKSQHQKQYYTHLRSKQVKQAGIQSSGQFRQRNIVGIVTTVASLSTRNFELKNTLECL